VCAVRAGVGDELAHAGLAGVPRDNAPEMVSSIRFSAEPSCPISVSALAGSTLDDRRGQPHLAAIEFEIGHLPGSFGNLDSGASWRRMMTMPAVVPPISATPPRPRR